MIMSILARRLEWADPLSARPPLAPFIVQQHAWNVQLFYRPCTKGFSHKLSPRAVLCICGSARVSV